MSVLDLYEEGFPHGSAAGYDRGCHGSLACPNHGSAETLTCLEAWTRRQSDYRTAKLPAATILERQPTEAAVKAKAKANVIRTSQYTGTRTEAATATVTPLTERELAATLLVPLPIGVGKHEHLTEKQRRGHYAKGCRLPDCRAAAGAYANHRNHKASVGVDSPDPVKHPARHPYERKNSTNVGKTPDEVEGKLAETTPPEIIAVPDWVAESEAYDQIPPIEISTETAAGLSPALQIKSLNDILAAEIDAHNETKTALAEAKSKLTDALARETQLQKRVATLQENFFAAAAEAAQSTTTLERVGGRVEVSVLGEQLHITIDR